MRTIAAISTSAAAAEVPASLPAMIQPRSPWHSPVPYLFGGLAAMLGLIAFALLILACSYWRLSRRDADDEDLEAGAEKDGGSGKAPKVYEEKILVIMAGHDTPTFLATPVCCRGSSFAGAGNGKCSETNDAEKTENAEKLKTVTTDNHHNQNTESQEEQEDHREQNQ